MLAEDTEVDIKVQESLVAMAKAVASATAALVSNARNVADKCDDEALQNQVIVAAKQVRLHFIVIHPHKSPLQQHTHVHVQMVFQ